MMKTIPHSRKIQDIPTIPIPIKIKNRPRLIGCLETRYTPFVTGFSTGVEANARCDITANIIPVT
jgi:hypothetical protein